MTVAPPTVGTGFCGSYVKVSVPGAASPSAVSLPSAPSWKSVSTARLSGHSRSERHSPAPMT